MGGDEVASESAQTEPLSEQDGEEGVDDSEKAKKIIIKSQEKIEKHPEGVEILYDSIARFVIVSSSSSAQTGH